MGFLEEQMMMMTTHHPYLQLEVACGLTMCCPNELRWGAVESWKKTMCSDLLQWKRSPITPIWQQQKQQLLHSPSFQTWAATTDLKHLSQFDRISLINSLLKDSHEDSSTFIKKVCN